MKRSTVQKEDQKEDLEIKENLLTKSPTMMPQWKRPLRQDETCILGMNAQNTEREGNSKSFFHACRRKKSRITRAKLK